MACMRCKERYTTYRQVREQFFEIYTLWDELYRIAERLLNPERMTPFNKMKLSMVPED